MIDGSSRFVSRASDILLDESNLDLFLTRLRRQTERRDGGEVAHGLQLFLEEALLCLRASFLDIECGQKSVENLVAEVSRYRESMRSAKKESAVWERRYAEITTAADRCREEFTERENDLVKRFRLQQEEWQTGQRGLKEELAALQDQLQQMDTALRRRSVPATPRPRRLEACRVMSLEGMPVVTVSRGAGSCLTRRDVGVGNNAPAKVEAGVMAVVDVTQRASGTEITTVAKETQVQTAVVSTGTGTPLVETWQKLTQTPLAVVAESATSPMRPPTADTGTWTAVRTRTAAVSTEPKCLVNVAIGSDRQVAMVDTATETETLATDATTQITPDRLVVHSTPVALSPPTTPRVSSATVAQDSPDVCLVTEHESPGIRIGASPLLAALELLEAVDRIGIDEDGNIGLTPRRLPRERLRFSPRTLTTIVEENPRPLLKSIQFMLLVALGLSAFLAVPSAPLMLLDCFTSVVKDVCAKYVWGVPI